MDLDDIGLFIDRALVGSLFEIGNGNEAALLANVDSAKREKTKQSNAMQCN